MPESLENVNMKQSPTVTISDEEMSDVKPQDQDDRNLNEGTSNADAVEQKDVASANLKDMDCFNMNEKFHPVREEKLTDKELSKGVKDKIPRSPAEASTSSAKQTTQDHSVNKPDPGEDEIERARQYLLGKTITLLTLMEDNLMEPGENVLNFDYMGQRFTGDLLSDGRIRWIEQDMYFSTPSAWACHCKNMINPDIKSGSGWSAVRYKGKRLDSIKSSWMKEQRSKYKVEDLMSSKEDSEEKSKEDDEESFEEADQPARLCYVEGERSSVMHASLGKRSLKDEGSTMVMLTPFSVLGKIQPFTISVSSSCLLLMDFHCRLTKVEVIGYVAGRWDAAAQHLFIQEAFPCHCDPSDSEKGAEVEMEIQKQMQHQGLAVVGWYHSHPNSQPDPSLRDIELQLEYEMKLKGEGHLYHPCIGFILSQNATPGSNKFGQKESSISAFWVMPPPEHQPQEHGMPMMMFYDVVREAVITPEIIKEMKQLVDLYQNSSQILDFSSSNPNYYNLLLTSVKEKLPVSLESSNLLLKFLGQLLQIS